VLSPGLFDLARFPRALDLQASTVVVTPTYRERDTVERHVRAVFSALPGVSLLVVDETSADGTSPDGTSDVVEALRGEFERLHLLRHAPPRSFSGSYKDGIAWALERGFSQVISMDADGSHGPVFLPLLLDLSTEADVVVGSRYLNGVSVLNWPLRRVLLSAFANIYCRWVTGVPCHDLTAGFCCYRAEMLRRIGVPRVRASGYAYQIEMKYRIWREGGRFAETNILFLERLAGTSKISPGRITEGLRHPWWCRFVLGPPKMPPPAPLYRVWNAGP
jgi:dolichol-phosphate mannosyltransferase